MNVRNTNRQAPSSRETSTGDSLFLVPPSGGIRYTDRLKAERRTQRVGTGSDDTEVVPPSMPLAEARFAGLLEFASWNLELSPEASR